MSLTALIALQALDSSIEQARRRLAELPGLEQTVASKIAAATAVVDAAKAKLQDNQTARRALEKDVAGVDARLSRFEDHKAAVKTNQEYTALLHEITTAKSEKDAIEEHILERMEEADGLAAEVKAAEAARAKAVSDGETTRLAMTEERTRIEGEVAALAADRARQAKEVPPRELAEYEQLLKNRRGLAVAAVVNSVCTACHVRLRPHVEQQARRNEGLVHCDSCQRIVYLAPAPSDANTPQAASR